MRSRTRALLVALCLACACDKPKSEADDKPDPNANKPSDAAQAFTEYQRKSMRSEAMVNGRMIGDLIRSRLALDGAAPESIPVTPPPGSCCKQPDGLCAVDDGNWDAPTWKALEFKPRNAHRYSYQVDVDGPKVTITATADLDCDGTLSTFAYEGTITNGDIEFDTDPIETHPLD